MYTYFRKDIIFNFYKKLRFTNFENISEERIKKLDELVELYRLSFTNNTIGFRPLMTYVAERLTASAKVYGLRNGDETAYFYIKTIDPNLQFLEIYESANMTSEVKDLCLLNFNVYDKYLIFLEKTYNNKFHEYDPDDLWSRDSIKR